MPGSSVLSRPHGWGQDSQSQVTRLLVSWQNPDTRTYSAVAVAASGRYEFAYLRRARDIPGFRPLPGFSDLTRRYSSPRLFPLFGERVMDPSRPDRTTWLNALALDGSAGPMEILARSGGHRQGDTIEVLPEPQVDATGLTTCDFMAHGVRYIEGASERITALSTDQLLMLRDQPENKKNPKALLVASDGDEPLGWVPEPLLGYVHDVRGKGTAILTVLRANGPEVGNHLRLLVWLRGKVSAGYRAFVGRDWETLA